MNARRQRASTPNRRVVSMIQATLMVLAAWFLVSTAALAGKPSSAELATPVKLVDGLAGGSGSTIGPDGALYVPEPRAGRIARVNPQTGQVTTFATGLPAINPAVGIGGVMDVEFLGRTAYALVTLVGGDTGGSDVVGIYRVDGPSSSTVIADIGAFSLANPPTTSFFVPTGVQYALEKYGRGFLVTDGHHNRVLHVTLDGVVRELIAFDNIVPTGLALVGRLVFMAQAGPVPHLPENGKVVAFGPWRHTVWEVASGAPLLVDVELGRGFELFALAQGTWEGPVEGSPALPFTGSLVEARLDGSFKVIAEGLNIPTSMEIIRGTAYVVSFEGEIWKVDGIYGKPGKRH